MGSMPSGPKHVQAGALHPGNNGHGEFNRSPGDATQKVTKHHGGAGHFPGGNDSAAKNTTPAPGDGGKAATG